MSSPQQPLTLVLPSAFPDTHFEAIKDRIIAKMPNPSPELDNFAGGHNAVRYRLRACADYSAEFVDCIRRVGSAPPLEDRYHQERQLFGFFISGIAALDSFNFCLYFAAAQLEPIAFPTQKSGHIKAIQRKLTEGRFREKFSGEPITDALTNLMNSSELGEWEHYRNILAHRSAPGRMIYASFGGSSPDLAPDWKIDSWGKKIDADLTPPYLEWLVKVLADLTHAADQFAQNYF